MTVIKVGNTTHMSGSCQFSQSDITLNPNDIIYRHKSELNKTIYDIQLGFVAHFTKQGELLLAAPQFDERGTIFRYRVMDKTSNMAPLDIARFAVDEDKEPLLFGFAIASGYFLKSTTIQYAASDPVRDFVSIIQHSSQLNTFF